MVMVLGAQGELRGTELPDNINWCSVLYLADGLCHRGLHEKKRVKMPKTQLVTRSRNQLDRHISTMERKHKSEVIIAFVESPCSHAL